LGGEEARRADAIKTCEVCAVAAPYCEGMLPAITLGIGPTDFKQCPAFTYANTIASLGLTNAPPFSAAAMLRICDSSACNPPVFFAPAVAWSPGRSHPATGAVSADELENLGVTAGTFIMHEEREPGHALGQFDDLVIWLSPSVLYSRLVSAGAL
jgi:hypothetical protein